MSISKVLSEWVSQWVELSCCGQLKIVLPELWGVLENILFCFVLFVAIFANSIVCKSVQSCTKMPPISADLHFSCLMFLTWLHIPSFMEAQVQGVGGGGGAGDPPLHWQLERKWKVQRKRTNLGANCYFNQGWTHLTSAMNHKHL